MIMMMMMMMMMMMNCFCGMVTDERRLALFSAGTIVRDPHHHESLTRQTGFKPAQNLSSSDNHYATEKVFSIYQ